ncbi:MAG: hypothetical protein U0746_23155 [Gemmataceae bacterium]
MHSSRPLFVASVALLVALAPVTYADATARSQNFIVTAPTQQAAQQFAQAAEHYRKEKALLWLGKEMPPWPKPCPLRVTPKMGGAGGNTKFNYDFQGGYEVLSMEIDGEMERMLHSVLPHEVTHTVFAHHFRYPVPRWADEGGSVLSEDDRERQTHDRLARDYLNGRQGVPLRRLFTLKEYQEISNVMVLYAQGFSVTNYLVGIGGRQAFLGFVGMGLRGEWDRASQTYFQVQSVEQLEQNWLQHLRDTKGVGAAQFAMNAQNGGGPARADLTNRVVTRTTLPPAQPQLDPNPVVRGQAGEEEKARPTHLPPVISVKPAPPPPKAVVPPLPPVRLGLPEFGPAPSPATSGKSDGG